MVLVQTPGFGLAETKTRCGLSFDRDYERDGVEQPGYPRRKEWAMILTAESP